MESEETRASKSAENYSQTEMTIDKIRKGLTNWSLANDADMLSYLQQCSQKMISRTHQLQQQLNATLHETKLTSVRVNITFNDFIMLANTQFVENRVYDEDTVIENAPAEEKTGEKNEKSNEERETDLVAKISEAVKLGLVVIETAYEKLAMNDANTDSEEEDSGYKPEAILEPKDPYLNRPLPYMIGSQAFLQDDDVGLLDYFSDDENEEEAESVEESNSDRESLEDEDEDMMENKKSTHNGIFADSDATSESEDSVLFSGDDSNDDDDDGFMTSGRAEQTKDEQIGVDDDVTSENQNGAGLNFKAELSAKISASGPPPAKKSTKHKEKPSKKVKNAINDDLFMPPNEARDDIDDSSAFGGGLFSAGKGGGLFDDEEGDLFSDDVKIAQNSNDRITVKSHHVADNAEHSPQEDQSTDESDDDMFSTKPPKSKAAAKSVGSTLQQQQKAIANEIAASMSGSKTQANVTKNTPGDDLFAESDEEDLFSTLSKNTSTKPVSKNILFDDEDDDEPDILSTAQTKEKTKQNLENVLQKGIGISNKFMNKDIPGDDETSSVHSNNTSHSSLAFKPSLVQKETHSSNSSLFSDDVDDLFKSEASNVKDKSQDKNKSTLPPKSQTTPGKLGALFGAESEEDTEDIFSISSKPAVNENNKKESKKTITNNPPPKSSFLFDDEEEEEDDETDDIFAASAPIKSTSTVSNEQKKKPAGSGLMFESNDLFESSPPVANSPSVESPTSFAQPQENVVVKPKKPPAGAVSMFGGLDPSALLKKKPKIVQDSDDDDVTDETGSPSVTRKQAHYVSSPILQKTPDEKANSPAIFDKPVVIPRTATKGFDKPPKVFTKPTIVSNSHAKGFVKPVFTPQPQAMGFDKPSIVPNSQSIGFDEPVTTPVLTSVTKDRPKVGMSRRPPSRRAMRDKVNSDQPVYEKKSNSVNEIHNRGQNISAMGSDHGVSALPKSNLTPSSSLRTNREIQGNDTIDNLTKDINFTSNAVRNPDPPQGGLTVENKNIFSGYNKTKVKVMPDLFASDDDDIFNTNSFIPETKLKGQSFVQSAKPVVSNKPEKDTLFEKKSNSSLKSKSSDDGDIFNTTHSLRTSKQPAILADSKPSLPEPVTILAAVDNHTNEDVDSKQKVKSWLENSEPVVKPSSKSVFEDDDDIFFEALAQKDKVVASGLKDTFPYKVVATGLKGTITDKVVASGLKDTVTDKVVASGMKDTITDNSQRQSSKSVGVKAPWAFDNDDGIFGDFNEPVKSKINPIVVEKEDIFSDFKSTSVRDSASKTENKKNIKTFNNNSSETSEKSKAENLRDVTENINPQVPTQSNIIDIFSEVDQHEHGKHTDGKADDDIFSDIPAASKVSKPQQADTYDDLFVDAFATAEKLPTSDKSKKQKAATKDEDLFKDETDIFADIPSVKPKATKHKSKKVVSQPDDTDIFSGTSAVKQKSKQKPEKANPEAYDDIFADSAPVYVKTKSSEAAKSSSKKKSKKSNALSSDSPNIFDDPLNALGK